MFRCSRWSVGRRFVTASWAVCLLAIVAGCSANSVDPLQLSIQRTVNTVEGVSFRRLCVEVNDAVDTELTQAVYASLTELGFATLSKAAAFDGECRYWLGYTAHTAGLTGYLREFRVTVYDRRSEIGGAHYDATSGASRPDRLGGVAAKMHDLLSELLASVDQAG